MTITTALTAGFVHGTTELEPTVRGLTVHRLPRHVRARDIDPQLTLMDAQPSGVRVVFTTRATEATLELHSTRIAYRGMARARGAVDVVIDGMPHSSHPLERGDVIEIDMQTGIPSFTAGDPEHITVRGLDAGSTRVEMWLPHNEQVELIAVHADAPIAPMPATGPVWVHHGSSISQGSNATSPTRIWPAVAARAAGVQLHNLGFGGSALVDPFMARVIRDTPADVISVKLGINVVGFDAMRLRSFVPAVHGFLDTIRDGHPTAPLLLVSPLFCGIHENTPGPGAIDPASMGSGTPRFIATGAPDDTAGGRLTLTVIREALAGIVEARADDPQLHYLDGLRLYSAADAEHLPLLDELHPDTETHVLIGERFARIAFGEDGMLQGAGHLPR